MPDQLRELQRLFAESVLVTGPYAGELDLIKKVLVDVPAGCWFSDNVPGLDGCGGDHGPRYFEAAHWIKRQRVEAIVGGYLREATVEAPMGDQMTYPSMFHPDEILEIVEFAAWDSRNAVSSCEKHHRRFDAHRMPTLVVPRHLVPQHVIEFTDDWGLETALEDRNPLEV